MLTRAKGSPIRNRAGMLAELMRLRFTNGVSGTRGKTTTTSLVYACLDAGALDWTVISGGYNRRLKIQLQDWQERVGGGGNGRKRWVFARDAKCSRQWDRTIVMRRRDYRESIDGRQPADFVHRHRSTRFSSAIIGTRILHSVPRAYLVYNNL